MSPVITFVALALCAGLVALVRAVIVAPVGTEGEDGFVFKTAARKAMPSSAATTLLGTAPARAHHRVRAA